MKLVKKMRGFSMPQMIASVAIASVLTAVGANYYWDIVDEAATVGSLQSVGVVRDTISLALNEAGGVVHKIDTNFIDGANSRVSGLDSKVGNVLISVSNAAGTESSWWYLIAAPAKESAKLKGLVAKLEAEYDAGVADAANGQVIYNNTCTAVQSQATTTYSDCYVAINVMNSPRTTLTLTNAIVTTFNISYLAGGKAEIAGTNSDRSLTGDNRAFILK